LDIMTFSFASHTVIVDVYCDYIGTVENVDSIDGISEVPTVCSICSMCLEMQTCKKRASQA